MPRPSNVFFKLQTKSMAHDFFLHGHVYSASPHYPMHIRAIDPVYPQAILPMGVTLFPSGTLCATYIPSRDCNNTICCSALNGEHAGEDVMSLQFIVFEICLCKNGKLPISRKCDL